MMLEIEVRNLLSRVERHGELVRGSMSEVSSDPIESLWQLASLLPIQPVELVPLLASATTSDLIEGTRALCAAGQEFLDEFESN